jgi:hypothetical protein
VAGLVGATVEGSAAAARVGAAGAATAVACILHRSRRSRSRRHMSRRRPSGLRRRRGCQSRKCMYLRTSIRLRETPAEDEGVGALPASALLSLPLGLLASAVLRY